MMADPMSSARNVPAEHPGMVWDQVRDTVRMLNLAVAQVTMSMHEGDESTSAMGNAFTALTERVRAIGEAAAALPAGPAQQTILEHCGVVNGQAAEFVTAFQFYDRLCQRLMHVSDSLGALAALVGDPERVGCEESWTALQEAIRAKYTMAAERAMFDAVMAGAEIGEALAQAQEPRGDDVELF